MHRPEIDIVEDEQLSLQQIQIIYLVLQPFFELNNWPLDFCVAWQLLFFLYQVSSFPHAHHVVVDTSYLRHRTNQQSPVEDYWIAEECNVFSLAVRNVQVFWLLNEVIMQKEDFEASKLAQWHRYFFEAVARKVQLYQIYTESYGFEF